ncbi:MAG: UDP-N-acetylmuramoyl-L-alanyl-D-glutamate--2,6-diaminopimelate ligase [Bacillota bacterium]
MRLALILQAVAPAGVTSQSGPTEVEVNGLAYDSRRVEAGTAFFAIKGFVRDGHDFIPQAIARGASCVFVEKPEAMRPPVPAEVPVIEVTSSRKALALAAAQFYGHPSKALRVIGVTGTNGKTTTTHLVRTLLSTGGRKVGLIGTIHNIVADRELPVERTTPESPDLQGLFQQMADAGSYAVTFEVSSHAIELHRVDGCEFDIGVLTNLTQDHLDFHHTFEQYLKAKAKLFERLGETYTGAPKTGPKAGVINADDPNHEAFVGACKVPVITYSLTKPADLRGHDLSVEAGGLSFTLEAAGRRLPVRLGLTGRFNAYNALAAMGVGLAEGMAVEEMADILAAARAVPGRLERVDAGQDFTVIVDYAHTPDGLENILQTARDFARGRVISVFGCGGDRDRTKRPIMGDIAGRYSDFAIITSDNPRGEDPMAIIREIETGIEGRPPRWGYTSMPDREEAIRAAVDKAEPGDVVVIAGKGHETYQIFKDRTIHFDDREVVRQALGERLR